MDLSRTGQETMAKWLNQTLWDIFLTITFRDERRSILGIIHSYYSTLNHIYELYNIYPVKSFLALEKHKYRMIPHIHSLIKFSKDTKEYTTEWEVDKNITIRTTLDLDKDFDVNKIYWQPIWELCYKKYGRTRIERYDINIGAGYYLSKYIYKPDSIVWWDVFTDQDWQGIRQGYLNFRLSLDR